MKYKVVISTLFVNGVKYRRGDIVDIDNGEAFGTNVEPVSKPESEPELVEVKPKRRRVKKSES